MGSILKFLLIGLAVVWLLYSPAVRGKVQGRQSGDKAPKPPNAGPKPHLDTMIACAHCGVHLPAAEAVTDAQGHRFCSPAHRDRNHA